MCTLMLRLITTDMLVVVLTVMGISAYYNQDEASCYTKIRDVVAKLQKCPVWTKFKPDPPDPADEESAEEVLHILEDLNQYSTDVLRQGIEHYFKQATSEGDADAVVYLLNRYVFEVPRHGKNPGAYYVIRGPGWTSATNPMAPLDYDHSTGRIILTGRSLIRGPSKGALAQFDHFADKLERRRTTIRDPVFEEQVRDVVVKLHYCPDWTKLRRSPSGIIREDNHAAEAILYVLNDLNQYSTNVLRHAIERCSGEPPVDGSIDAKVYLLVRYIFDVPRSGRFSSSSYVMAPLDFDSAGRIVLTGRVGWLGVYGGNPLGLFDVFSRKYERRKMIGR